jgi:hypothetical protein
MQKIELQSLKKNGPEWDGSNQIQYRWPEILVCPSESFAGHTSQIRSAASSGARFGSHAAPAASTRCERQRTQRSFSPPRCDALQGTSISEVVRQGRPREERNRVKVQSAANLDAAKGMRTGRANGLGSTRDNQWVRRGLSQMTPFSQTIAANGGIREAGMKRTGVSGRSVQRSPYWVAYRPSGIDPA